MDIITSLVNPQLKEINKLQSNAKYRKKSGRFVVEGIKLVHEAEKYSKLLQIFIAENFFSQHQREFDDMEIKVYLVKENIFRQITDTINPQGILAIVKQPVYKTDFFKRSSKELLYLLLDDLRDPGNLGTIVRTAEGAGVDGVILNHNSVDIFNPKVVRATMGAIFRVPFIYVDSLCDTICEMKNQGIEVYGTMMEGSICYTQVDFLQSSAIVIGNEANGLSDEVIQVLSQRIRIPMAGQLESLNAGVSAAIVAYEAARQRRGEK